MRDSTVAAHRVQSVTVLSFRVTRECRFPGLKSPPPLKTCSEEEGHFDQICRLGRLGAGSLVRRAFRRGGGRFFLRCLRGGVLGPEERP